MQDKKSITPKILIGISILFVFIMLVIPVIAVITY